MATTPLPVKKTPQNFLTVQPVGGPPAPQQSLAAIGAPQPKAGVGMSGAPSLTSAYDDNFKQALEASRAGVVKQFELALSDINQREGGANQAVGQLGGQVSTIYQQGQQAMTQNAQNLDAAQAASGLKSFAPASQSLAPLQAAGANDLAARQADIPLLQLAVQGEFGRQRSALGQARTGAEEALGAEERGYLQSLAQVDRNRSWDKFLVDDERSHQNDLLGDQRKREDFLVNDQRKNDQYKTIDERKNQEKVTAGERSFAERMSKLDQDFQARQSAADRAHSAGLAAAARSASAGEAAAGRAAADRRAAEDRVYNDRVRHEEQGFALTLRELDRIAEVKGTRQQRDSVTGLKQTEINKIRQSKDYKAVLESLRDTKKSSGFGPWRNDSGHGAAKPEDIYKKYRSRPAVLKVLVSDIPELAAYMAGEFGATQG